MRIASPALAILLIATLTMSATATITFPFPISSFSLPSITYTILSYFYSWYPADLQNVVATGTTQFTASTVT